MRDGGGRIELLARNSCALPRSSGARSARPPTAAVGALQSTRHGNISGCRRAEASLLRERAPACLPAIPPPSQKDKRRFAPAPPVEGVSSEERPCSETRMSVRGGAPLAGSNPIAVRDSAEPAGPQPRTAAVWASRADSPPKTPAVTRAVAVPRSVGARDTLRQETAR